MMRDMWCRRLAIAVGVWAVLALALQVVVSLALR
jgi:hypothetical protein